jgi:TRAP-type C4-dicarboxylate transport system permease small subunit
MIAFIKKFVGIFRLLEKWLLVVFLGLIIFISSLQIILRNFDTAIEWFDSFLKYCVLWAGMIAAGIATYEDRHIKIDIIGRFTKGKAKEMIQIVTNFFAGVVCVVLFIGFLVYIITIEYPSTDLPPFLNVKRWMLLLICPFSFFLMSVRFFTLTAFKIKSSIYYKELKDKKTNGAAK